VNSKAIVFPLLLCAGFASAQSYGPPVMVQNQPVATPAIVNVPSAAPPPMTGSTVFTTQARVRSVQPQYESVQIPREECSVQFVTEQPAAPASGGIGAGGYGGVIVGGVAGALLGNRVGKGSGREAATAAGAVVGAVVGDKIANSNAGSAMAAQPIQREMRTCRTVYDLQQRLTGYRVTYDYNGIEATAFTRDQPGATLPIRVTFAPDIR
jgi:uncharacterized protein YcfJ